jgi:CxxC motif-containing protein (DUF1111 family)
MQLQEMENTFAVSERKEACIICLQQTVNAYNQDMGITSAFEPKDVYTGLDIEPEISLNKVHDVVFYLQTLKVPIQRNAGDGDVIAGKQIFRQRQLFRLSISLN